MSSTPTLRAAIGFLLLGAVTESAPAQLTAPEATVSDSMVYRGRSGQLAVSVPRLDDPRLAVDGRLDEPAWATAAVLTGFSQYEPVEGLPATEETEVRVFYTRDAIYFGIRAFDRSPDLVVARLGERDRSVFGDDWVRIMLDTFDDQRQAYVFYVNPLGLQTDGLWLEGLGQRPGRSVPIDFNPDFIWESDGRVNAEGWAAEIRIPYVSLRFRDVAQQDWGINVAREVKRRGFKQSWAPLTQNVSSTLQQSGRLTGLRGLRPRRLIEFNPVATGRRVGRVVNGAFEREPVEGDYGLNARLGVTQNLVLDATVNPDFSQVEADANQITVNERFALFFAEKRPFFLEGTEIFRTPRNLVHTRQIVDPAGGAKVTGKVGAFNVGYLGALDESPVSLLGEAHRAAFNLVRVRRDVGDGSTIGLLYTDRTGLGGGEFNRVLSGDARWLLDARHTLTLQLAGSWTAAGGGGSGPVRPLALVEFVRSGRRLGWNVKLDDVHPGFRTRSGFIPRIGDTEVLGSVNRTWFGRPGSVLERFRMELRVNAFFDHDDFWRGRTPYEWEVEVQPTITLRGGRTVTAILRDGFFSFRAADYVGYEVGTDEGNRVPFPVPESLGHMKALALFPRARITNTVQLNGRLFLREIPIFAEAARGFEFQLAPDVTLRPTTALQLSVSHTFSRIWRRRDQTQFSTVHLSRVRVQYQFDKALFVRTVVQYDLEDRDALRDPGTERPLWVGGVRADRRETGRFDAQFLASYEPSPGTVFFVGYSRTERGERSYRLTRMEPQEDGFFLKLSYLFRL